MVKPKVLSLKSEPLTRVYVGDCRNILPSFKKLPVKLVFADPPYNIDVQYDNWDDAMDDDAYWDFTKNWLSSAVDMLDDDGSLFTYVPPQLGNRIAVYLEQELKMHYVNDICVVQRFGQHQTGRFVSGHRRLTYHCKDMDLRIWNMQDVLEDSLRASKYNDKRTMTKKEHKGQRVPLDVWGWDEDHFGRVQGNNKERRPLHPNQVPEKVLERVIRATTSAGDLVVDPFAGSGTTGTVARALGRESRCCEISSKFARSAIKRMQEGPYRVK